VKFFSPRSLKDIIEFLLDYSVSNPITVVIDEFQDIARAHNSFYSDLQNLWDQYKVKSKMHLVACGSIYNLMNKLKEQNEHLLNRDDHYYHLMPLAPSYIKSIMMDEKAFSADNYLLWWCLSGGTPKYIEWLAEAKIDPINLLIKANSPLLKEGNHRLVEDFGEEHRAYFDILGAIASGYNTAPEIANYLSYQINKALPVLVESYEIVRRVISIDANANTKNVRYEIADPFLRFWFRFIYKTGVLLKLEITNTSAT
jgi:AAA+ ATPase superfamily predicted ATPase